MRTDIAGAAGQGLDALIVAAGIHRDALDVSGAAAADDELQSLFRRENLRPVAAMRELAP